MLLVALVALGLVAALVVTLVVVLPGSSGGQGPLDAKTGGRNTRISLAQSAAIGQAISVSGPLVVQNSVLTPDAVRRRFRFIR